MIRTMVTVFVGLVFACIMVSLCVAMMNETSDVALLIGLSGLAALVIFATAVGRAPAWRLLARMTKHLLVIALPFVTTGCVGCERIDPGNVGIKINLAGSNRGVQDVPFVTGWVFYNQLTENVLEYPTYMQTVVWQNEKGGANEELSFNSSEGLPLTADLSLSYFIEADKVPAFYVQFRSDDLQRFTHGYLRNVARDQFNEVAGTYLVENLYGPKKEEFIQTVKKRTNERLNAVGVVVDQLGFIGAPRPPASVINAINAKIASTQQAMQAENELRRTEAEAKKQVAEAQEQAQSQIARAEGEAKARVARADGEAKANQALGQSITPALMEWRRLEIAAATTSKWNGQLPTVDGSGSHGMLLQLGAPK